MGNLIFRKYFYKMQRNKNVIKTIASMNYFDFNKDRSYF